MIKILHMTPPIVNNGIYRYIFSNLEYIDKEKFEFHFLTQTKNDLKKTEAFRKYRFGIHSFSTTQRDDPDGFRKEIYGILSEGYDAIHLHTSFWRGFLIEEIAMEIGVPKVIVHSHSTGVDIENQRKRRQIETIHMEFKEKFGCEHATHFWACSKLAADWLYGDRIPRDRIRIMNNAIRIDQFKYNRSVREICRKNLGLQDCFVIGHTGRFEYQKNHEFLVRAFYRIYHKNPHARLMLVGQGQNYTKTKRLVKELELQDVVLFLGWRNDVPDLLQAMDVYCLPSRFEGMPIVLIEAQAAGLKCIASSRITMEAKVTENLTFLDLDEEQWVKEIESLVSGYERQDTSVSLQRAGYDITSQIRQLESAYMEE